MDTSVQVCSRNSEIAEIPKKRISKLFSLAMALLPFDAVPIFPSDYRPISIIFLLLLSPKAIALYLKKLRLPIELMLLIGFLLVSIIISALLTWVNELPWDGYLRFVITDFMAIVVILVTHQQLRILRRNSLSNDVYIQRFAMLYTRIAWLLFSFGIIQIIRLKTGLWAEQVDAVTMMVAGSIERSVALNRIQLFSGEPSWAAHLLLIYLPFIFISSRAKTEKIMLGLIGVVLFWATFSLKGYILLLLAIVCSGFWIKKKDIINLVVYLILITMLVWGIGQGIFWMMRDSDISNYLGNRLNLIRSVVSGEATLEEVLLKDESMYIRINYPLIGFKIMMDHPLLGVGCGNYRYYWGEYVSLSQRFREAQEDAETVTADPKNLYARVGSETGIFGLLLVIYTFFRVLRRLDKAEIANNGTRIIMTFIVIAVMCQQVQFGSYAYIPLWTIITMVVNLSISEPLYKTQG